MNTKTGQQVADAIRHELREDTIIHPAISPQGELIATRATRKSVQLLDLTTRKMIGNELEYPTEVDSIRFSEEGKLLFVGAGGSLHAIDSETGQNVAGPIKSGGLFHYFPQQQKLVTTEPVYEGLDRLVIRATDQAMSLDGGLDEVVEFFFALASCNSSSPIRAVNFSICSACFAVNARSSSMILSLLSIPEQ